MRHQMESLMQAIAASSHERLDAVANSKAQTARMLQSFGRERMASSREMNATLAADCAGRSAAVGRLLDDAGTARAAFAKSLHHMARVQHNELLKDCRLRGREVAKMVDGFQAARSEMAEELHESLTASIQTIKSCVSGLLVWREGRVHSGGQTVRTPTARKTFATLPERTHATQSAAVAKADAALRWGQAPSPPIAKQHVAVKKAAPPATPAKKAGKKIAAPVKSARKAGRAVVKAKKR